MFFGNIYANNPSSFKFSLGERVLISEIVLFVTKTIDEHGVKYFFDLKNNQQKLSTKTYPIIGRFFCDETENDTIVPINQIETWKNGLYNDVLRCYNELGIDFENCDDDIVTLFGTTDGKLIAKTKCIFCVEHKRKKFEYNVPYKMYKDTPHWMLQNLRNHLKSDLKKQSTLKEIVPKQKVNHVHSTQNKIEKYKPQDNATKYEIEDNGVNEETIPSNEQIEEILVDIEYIRSKMFAQISDQMIKMTEKCENHDETPTIMKFMCENEENDAQIATIEQDGNCLFNALAHQLFDLKLRSDQLAEQSAIMRASVVKLINENKSKFESELQGSISNQSINNENNMKAYDDYIIQLAKNGFWGGAEVYRAVTLIHQVNILIINANANFYFPLGFDISLEQTVLIAYKSNIHYDSIVHIDALCIFRIVNDILSRLEIQKPNDHTTVNMSNKNYNSTNSLLSTALVADDSNGKF